MPPYQRQGIGTSLIRDVIGEAQAAGLALRISAATINPARRLYERLGFVLTGEERWKVNFIYRG
jgi:ribosomal protein S18 acetylase RimI-like enzyme